MEPPNGIMNYGFVFWLSGKYALMHGNRVLFSIIFGCALARHVNFIAIFVKRTLEAGDCCRCQSSPTCQNILGVEVMTSGTIFMIDSERRLNIQHTLISLIPASVLLMLFTLEWMCTVEERIYCIQINVLYAFTQLHM